MHQPFPTQVNEAQDAPVAPGERVAFWGITLLIAIVHWIPPFPPQVDLAQHAAQIQLLHDWQRAEFPFRDRLELNFFTPYLPAYIVGYALALVLPVVTAVKLLWTCGTLATVLAAVRLRAAVGGTPHWDWFVLLGLFSTTYRWGLLNFHVTIPLGLVLVRWWWLMLAGRAARHDGRFALALAALFFCHSLVTAWVMAVCGLMLLARRRDEGASWPVIVRRGLVLLAPMPSAVLWWYQTKDIPQASRGAVWGSVAERVIGVFARWLGEPGSLIAVAVGLLVLALPLMLRARRQAHLAPWAALATTLAFILLAPDFVFGNAFTHSRFDTLLGPSLVLAFASGSRRDHRLRLLLPAVAIALVGGQAVRGWRLRQEQRSMQRVFAALPRHQHVASLRVDIFSGPSQAEPAFLHAGAWAQATRGGLTEFSFAALLPTVVRFRTPPLIGERDEPLAFGADALAWAATHLHDVDYLLVRAPAPYRAPLVALPVREVAHDGRWWLYRPTHPRATSPRSARSQQ